MFDNTKGCNDERRHGLEIRGKYNESQLEWARRAANLDSDNNKRDEEKESMRAFRWGTESLFSPAA